MVQIGRAELGRGVDAALLQMKLGGKARLSLLPPYVSPSPAETADVTAGASADKVEVQVELVKWIAVEDLSAAGGGERLVA